MKMVTCLLAFTVVLLSQCPVASSRSLTSFSSHGADAQPEGGRKSRAVLQPPTAAADQPPRRGMGDDAVQSLAKSSGLLKQKSHAKAPPKHHGHGHHAPPADLSPPAPDTYGDQPPEAPAPTWPEPQPKPGNQWPPFRPPPLPAWPHPDSNWPPLPPFPFHPPPLPAWPQPEPGKQWPPLPPFPAWPQPEPGKQWPPFPAWPQPEPGNNQWPPLPPFPEWPQPEPGNKQWPPFPQWPQPEPGNNQWPPLPPFPIHPPPMPTWQWPPEPSFHGEEERRTSSLPPPVPTAN